MKGSVSRNLKAVHAVLGGLATVGAMLLLVSSHLPTPVAGVVGSAVAALTAFNVWWAKNETVIEDAAGAADELVEVTVGAFQKRGAV